MEKNGKFIYFPLISSPNYYFNMYMCIVNKIKLSSLIQFPYLNSKNKDEIIKKLLILKYIQKNSDLKYFHIRNDYIEIFNSEVQEKIITYYFLQYLQKKDIIFYNNLKNTMLKRLTLHFLYLRITYSEKIKNEQIFIIIFFQFYIKEIAIPLDDFENYHTLYLFLKKHGYVNKYYNLYTKKILNQYMIFYHKINTHPLFNTYYKKKIETIKNFKDINLNNLIDTNVDPKNNIKYIKNKFLAISKKYNV